MPLETLVASFELEQVHLPGSLLRECSMFEHNYTIFKYIQCMCGESFFFFFLLYTLNEKKKTQNQHKHTMRYTEH